MAEIRKKKRTSEDPHQQVVECHENLVPGASDERPTILNCALDNHIKKQCKTTQPSVSTDGASNQDAKWQHHLDNLLELHFALLNEAIVRGVANQIDHHLSDLLGIHFMLSTM